MKIIINKSDNYKTLLSVDYGECFIPEGCEDDVFLKTRGVVDYGECFIPEGCEDDVFLKTRGVPIGMYCYKCVNLSTGDLVEFSELKMVRIVKSEVVVDENV